MPNPTTQDPEIRIPKPEP